MGRTSIEWCSRQRADGSLMPGYTFNAWWGCTEAGPECDSCYARTFAHRLGLELWGASAERRFFGDRHWNEPRRWDRRAAAAGEQHLVFCQSMSDVLENRRDLDPQRERLWTLIEETRNLIWLLLTKRPSGFATLTPERWRRDGWPPNVWAGTTSGTQRTADVMVPQLLKAAAGARVRFLSVEPLLETVQLQTPFVAGYDYTGRGCSIQRVPRVDWLIAGSESGGHARPMDEAWVRSLRDQCQDALIPFFYKQQTVGRRVVSLPELAGRQWREFPEVAR